MTKRSFLAMTAFLLAQPVLADDLAALSTTAMAITGDIKFDDFEIVFENGEKLAFDALVADRFIVDGQSVPASVYSVAPSAAPELLNGNRLCGNEPVTFLASWIDGDVTAIAVFDTPEQPESDATMCALYTYVYP